MTVRMLVIGSVSGFLLACTGAAPSAEIPPPAPEPTADPPARAKAGKRAKGGKRPDVAGCPDGVTAAPSWPGEWPGPVVDVVRAVTVQARAEPCSRPSFDCSVPVGIYHPWSTVEAEYVTVRTIDKFDVVKDVDVDELHAKAGDVVEVYQTFGEGYCGYRVDGKEVTAPCPELLGDALKPVPGGRDMPDRQLFSVSCGGKTGWIEANPELLALPEVREGTMPEYGTVGPGTN